MPRIIQKLIQYLEKSSHRTQNHFELVILFGRLQRLVGIVSRRQPDLPITTAFAGRNDTWYRYSIEVQLLIDQIY